jgi:hypothetical protein
MNEHGDKHDHDDDEDHEHEHKQEGKHGEHDEGGGEDKGKGEDKDDDKNQAPGLLPTRPKPIYFHTGVDRRVDIFRAGTYFFASRGGSSEKAS